MVEYVQVKPILTAATLILKATGTYKEGELSWSAGYLYVSFVYNISICLRYALEDMSPGFLHLELIRLPGLQCALQQLVLPCNVLGLCERRHQTIQVSSFCLTKACGHHLTIVWAGFIRPMPKFLCVKGILFFSFWQAITISALVAIGAIRQGEFCAAFGL